MSCKITIDNKLVADGDTIYKIIHTHGMPLSLTLLYLNKSNAVIDWEEYFKTAILDKMILLNEYRRCKEAIYEIFEEGYFKEWDLRARTILMELMK